MALVALAALQAREREREPVWATAQQPLVQAGPSAARVAAPEEPDATAVAVVALAVAALRQEPDAAAAAWEQAALAVVLARVALAVALVLVLVLAVTLALALAVALARLVERDAVAMRSPVPGAAREPLQAQPAQLEVQAQAQ